MKDRLFSIVILCVVVGAPFGMALYLTLKFILNFVFYWPLFMSCIWMTGGIYFWWRYERHMPWKREGEQELPDIPGNPLISILIPCYNEGRNARETISAAARQCYSNIEIIAIDDGSSDDTFDVLLELSHQFEKLRVIKLDANQGKAVALNTGILAAKGDYVVCIDGDALLEPEAVTYLCEPLVNNPNLGAVTGNPRIRTRTTIIGRVQVGEFSSIIGLIKRTQSLQGRLFTVSGVVAAFRKSALTSVDYWSPEMMTEDIDISWKLQLRGWGIRYEPRGLCWILMPETLKGLWKQRLRWAQGGAEVFLKNIPLVFKWQHRTMWPLLSEYIISILWVFALALSLVLMLVGMNIELPQNLYVQNPFPPGFSGMVLCITCLFQFAISLLIDRRYESHFVRSMLAIVWYPLAFWMISFLTSLVSFTRVMIMVKKGRARWQTLDRGLGNTGVGNADLSNLTGELPNE